MPVTKILNLCPNPAMRTCRVNLVLSYADCPIPRAVLDF